MFKDRSDYEPPPDPNQRTWVHPSELGPVVRPHAPGRHRGLWAGLGATGLAVVGVVGFLTFSATQGPDRRSRLGALTRPIGVTGSLAPIVTIDATNAASTSTLRRGSGISVGNGVVVTSVGLVPTDGQVRVNGTSAQVLVRDPYSDVAVLQTPLLLDAALLAPDDLVQPDDTLTLTSRSGNAIGAVREPQTMATTADGTIVAGLVSTTFPIARDAIGSAVFNERGVVVGIVSSVSGMAAYVIPVGVIRDVVDQARRSGSVRHGTLLATLTETARGVTVTDVTPDGPAARADLRVGDIIVAIDATDTTTAGRALSTIRSATPGTRVTITSTRNGETRRTSVTVAALTG